MPVKAERPVVVTLFCALVAAAMLMRLLVTLISADLFAPLRLTYIIAHKFAILIAVVGMWRLRRWGVGLYAAVSTLAVLLYFLWPPQAVLAPAAVIGGLVIGLGILAAVTLPFWKRFT